MAEGLGNRESGERLFVGEATVETNVQRILRKLDSTTRTRAATRARELMLIYPALQVHAQARGHIRRAVRSVTPLEISGPKIGWVPHFWARLRIQVDQFNEIPPRRVTQLAHPGGSKRIILSEDAAARPFAASSSHEGPK